MINVQMPFSLTTVSTPPKPCSTFAALISFLLILSHEFITATKTETDKTQYPGTDPFQTACAVPKRWKIPTEEHPMKIGIPGNTSFEKFVKVKWTETLDEKKYDGFCIDIFKEVLKVFLEKNYTLRYEFVPFNATYDKLVEGVSNGTFDAAVGDITILTNRSKHVEFTQPFMESRLVMIAPAKPQEKEWKFLKPFTMEMWLATGAILIYTMLIVWFLEHRSNPEFSGPWMKQLGTAFWFTFSSLFFSHKEKIHSNFTRVVVTVWLFVVLVLNSSYTASLTSMLTVSQLEPKVTSIEWLRKTNSNVGYGAWFLTQYLESDLKFKEENIKKMREDEYVEAFESGKIAAVFLELPYGKDFISQHGKGYTMTEPIYKRFGGLGFVFQKCSPIATNVSEAILTLLENGELKKLENKWFGNSFESSDSETTNKAESLSLQSFWGVYVISAATSTLLFLIHLLKNYRRHLEEYASSSTS